MEPFIAAALEAFIISDGDVDKFELSLRRAIMSQQTAMPAPISLNPMIDSNLEITPEMAEELAAMDLDSMSDEEVVQYATRMGLVK